MELLITVKPASSDWDEKRRKCQALSGYKDGEGKIEKKLKSTVFDICVGMVEICGNADVCSFSLCWREKPSVLFEGRDQS